MSGITGRLIVDVWDGVRKAAVLCVVGLLSFPATSAAQGLYTLQPGDVLEVWLAQDEQLNHSITVGPDGRISLPLVGHISAEGRTAEEIEQEIVERLRPYYAESIDIAIMLTPAPTHMPSIFVTGDVTTPGVYAYRPGMTVLHAITLGGGPYREALAARDMDRSIILRSEIEATQRQAVELTVTIARLEAELAGATEIALPEEMPYKMAESQLNAIVQREQSALNSRMAALRSQQEAAEELKARAERTVEAVREQQTSIERRRELARQRLESARTLVERGHMQRAQMLEQEQDLAELDGTASELVADLAQAEAEQVNENLRAETLSQARRIDAIGELNEARRNFEVLGSTLADNQRALSVYTTTGAEGSGPEPVSYRIMRTVDGEMHEIEATRSTLVLPGDLVEMVKGLPAD